VIGSVWFSDRQRVPVRKHNFASTINLIRRPRLADYRPMRLAVRRPVALATLLREKRLRDQEVPVLLPFINKIQLQFPFPESKVEYTGWLDYRSTGHSLGANETTSLCGPARIN
jgi:hypothetical protein